VGQQVQKTHDYDHAHRYPAHGGYLPTWERQYEAVAYFVIRRKSQTLAPGGHCNSIELQANLGATARQLHDEARSQILTKEEAYRVVFRPHLQVETERRIPSPIFIAGFLTTARLRILPLPDDALSTDSDTRNRIIKSTIIEHYLDHGGRVPAFGRIVAYVLVLLPGYDGVDFGLPFDVYGNPAGSMRKVRAAEAHADPGHQDELWRLIRIRRTSIG